MQLVSLRAPLIAALATVAFPLCVRANHGPGTSGGGSYTVSGETLKQGKFDLTLREDYTRFEQVDRAEAESRAQAAGEFDALEEAYLTSASLSYGFTDDLQAGATIGYYAGHNFIDAESEDGAPAESASGDPEGITDLTLSAKLRVMRGAPGNLSVVAGLIAPTGNDNQRLAGGELLEPSSQPGTGAWAFQAGLGYSRFLTPQWTIDASGVYTLRTEHDGFEVGDRLDLGLAFAYRLTESIKAFPNWSVFGELNAVWLGKDDSDEEGTNPNSGGWTAYLTPGLRVRFSPAVSLSVAPSFPILQELNGEQLESRFKLAAAMSFSF